MTQFCACNGTQLNTGVPNKQKIVSSGVKMFVSYMKADDGTENGILPNDTIDQTYLDGKINEVDPSKRWYPLGEFKQQEDVRGDAITESFSDGSSKITQQGVRTYLGWLLDYAPKYLENLKSFKCVDFGVYMVQSCGDVVGSVNSDGTLLKPIRVNKGSWNPTYVKGTSTVSPKIQLAFEYSMLEKDENLRVIPNTEITADLLNAEGLLELNAAITGIVATGFVAALTVDYDAFTDPSQSKVEGWVDADFKLFNNTTNLAVVITSVTEAPKGTYTFVIPAQTAADELELTNDLTAKPGYHLKETIIAV
jgi:hypothetical protein